MARRDAPAASPKPEAGLSCVRIAHTREPSLQDPRRTAREGTYASAPLLGDVTVLGPKPLHPPEERTTRVLPPPAARHRGERRPPPGRPAAGRPPASPP